MRIVPDDYQPPEPEEPEPEEDEDEELDDVGMDAPPPAPVERLPELPDDAPLLLKTVHLFSQLGSLKAVSRALGIPIYELQKLQRTQAWLDEYNALQREEMAISNVRMTRILDQTLEAIEDRLINGDYHFTGGKAFRRPCDAKTLARLTDVIFDKRQLLRNLPTQIEASTSKLAELAEKLEALGKARRAGEIIDVQASDVEDED